MQFNIPNGRPTAAGWPTPLEVSSTRIQITSSIRMARSRSRSLLSRPEQRAPPGCPAAVSVFARQRQASLDPADLLSVSIDAGEVDG
jgi:hypothetical protein